MLHFSIMTFWIANIIKLSRQNLEFFEKRLEFFSENSFEFFSALSFLGLIFFEMSKKSLTNSLKMSRFEKEKMNSRKAVMVVLPKWRLQEPSYGKNLSIDWSNILS